MCSMSLQCSFKVDISTVNKTAGNTALSASTDAIDCSNSKDVSNHVFRPPSGRMSTSTYKKGEAFGRAHLPSSVNAEDSAVSAAVTIIMQLATNAATAEAILEVKSTNHLI